jgi:sugar lactone lactonase YvrE
VLPLVLATSLCALPAVADDVTAVPPPAIHPVETIYGEAVAAAGRQDWPAYLDAVERARALAPGQPALERRRAEALAQLGRADEAMAILRAMTGWGVELPLGKNELLAPLRERADWPALVAAASEALRPRGAMTPSFTVPQGDLIPEGIAYDPVDDVFYLSSIARRKIVRVNRDGRGVDLIAPDGHGFLAGLGLAVDAGRRRLWAVSTAQPDDGLFNEATNHTSAVHVFDLATGGLLWRYFTAQADSFGLNDICVLPGGGAAASVSDRGLVLRFGPDGGAPVALTAPGSLPGANGLCVGPGGDCLYVSAYVLGVMKVDLRTGAVTAATVPGADFTTSGVDGIYLVDGGLVAVQNYMGLDRVARFTLRDDGMIDGCVPLVSRQEMFVDPTTGAIAPDGFHFIADSYVSPFYAREDKGVMTGFGRSRVMRVGVE